MDSGGEQLLQDRGATAETQSVDIIDAEHSAVVSASLLSQEVANVRAQCLGRGCKPIAINLGTHYRKALAE